MPQATQPEGIEEGTTQSHRPAGSEPRAGPLPQEPAQSLNDIEVDLDKLRRRIAGAKVLAPAAHHPIHVRNPRAEVVVAAAAWRQRSHPRTHLPQRPLRWPPLQIVDALPRPYPEGPAHALAQMTPEEVESLAAAREVDQPRLLRVQLKPETSQHDTHPSSRFLDRRLRVAHDHEIVGVANQCAQVRTPVLPHLVAGRCWRAAARLLPERKR